MNTEDKLKHAVYHVGEWMHKRACAEEGTEQLMYDVVCQAFTLFFSILKDPASVEPAKAEHAAHAYEVISQRFQEAVVVNKEMGGALDRIAKALGLQLPASQLAQAVEKLIKITGYALRTWPKHEKFTAEAQELHDILYRPDELASYLSK